MWPLRLEDLHENALRGVEDALTRETALVLSKVSHTWRARAQRRRQEEQAKRRAIGCAYCKSADDDAQVEGEEGDDVDTHLYTMWELTRGGGCRRVPQSWRSQSVGAAARGSSGLRQVAPTYQYGCECATLYVHRHCVRAHAAAMYLPTHTYCCVVCHAQIWRPSAPSRRGESLRWEAVQVRDL